jgi:RNA polymerase sigma-70 factor (ECF subfamily)
MAKPDFEDLVAGCDERLFNVMYGLTGDYHDALDLTEEAFIKAMRAYPRFRGDSDPFTWLYRIAVNVFRKRYRREARRTTLWREHLEKEPPASAETRTPDRGVLDEERDLAVRQAIALLPRVNREVITLRYIDEMSYEDIATTVGCSMGTVKSRISRGKAALADLLEGKV